MDARHTVASICAVTTIALSASCAPVTGMPDTGAIAGIVREAREAGGRDDPAAAYYLDLAERALARAEVQVRVRDRQGALSFARRARADAEMARLLAVEAAVREAARRAEDHAEALFRALEAHR